MRLWAIGSIILFAVAGLLRAEPLVAPRLEVGNRVSENLPAIPDELLERLNRYQNTRGAGFSGWLADGSMLINTRFAETNQAHRVARPLGMREQLTFYAEPLNNLGAAPLAGESAVFRNGFVFGKDRGGDEFWQLYYFDLATREVRLLTDGLRSRNEAPQFSHDGNWLAYSSTARNGTDSDIWLRGPDGTAKALLTEGGTWYANDFSPDAKQLLVMKMVSVNEVYPGVVDLATGKLTMFPIDGERASFGGFHFAPDGSGAYFTSDEDQFDADGKRTVSEFQTLRYHDFASNRVTTVSSEIAWNVVDFLVSRDNRHIAYVSNEDGVGKLHVLTVAERKEIVLPSLPIGWIQLGDFSADGQRLALTLNSATSPSDVYVVGLQDGSLTRWTQSEVGGLDASTFVAPTLVRYKSFDRREIPAFYYAPKHRDGGAPAGKLPVVIQIHGGPESQALPTFNAHIQFLVRELNVAVLVPNVRGSAGYGKSYLLLDNGAKREDSVKDIGALLDWIKKQPELDAQRVGVSGGSYGGYMVLAALTHYPKRIKAGVDIVGISNFITFLTNTESYRRDLRRAEYGDERDAEMRKLFEKISPLNNAERIKSPLFVAQGQNDPRVPVTEAEQIVRAVRGNGQPVWYLMFKDEGHGFAKKSNADYFGAAAVLFWQQYLIGTAP